MGFFDKLKKINIFASFGSELTDDFYDELEESLILADTGMDTTLELVEELRRRVREERIKTVEEARTCMCRCIAGAMQVGDTALDLSLIHILKAEGEAAHCDSVVADLERQS